MIPAETIIASNMHRVAKYFGVSVEYMKQKRRNPHAVMMRDLVVYLSRMNHNPVPFALLSQMLNYQSPESTRHSLKRALQRIEEKDPFFYSALHSIKRTGGSLRKNVI